MANEQTVIIQFQALKGNFNHRINPGAKQYDMAVAEGGAPGAIAVTTAAASISFGSVAPGYVYIHNLSTGSTVNFQTTGGLKWGKFSPGKMAILPKGTDTWQAVAVSGTANVDIRGFAT